MTLPEKRSMEVNLEFPVRTYDIDYAGVVSNIVYIRWLEDLRLTILETYYPLEKLLEAGLAPTLVETRIRYHRPVTIQDRPAARMWVTRLSRLKFEFYAEFKVGGEVVTTAEQVGCLIDLSSGRPARMPDEFRAAYEAQRKS